MDDCRIHILGASGSGTTTLGKAVASELQIAHFDSDDFYWKASDPPFVESNPVEDRLLRLNEAAGAESSWVLSGSLCGWGDPLVPRFTLVVLLQLPREIRMKRLVDRETRRYGSRGEPGGDLFVKSREFLNWAARYDDGGLDVRSLRLHELWVSRLTCTVLKLNSDAPLEKLRDRVLNEIATGSSGSDLS